MQRIVFFALLASVSGMATASAQPMQINPSYQNARATAAVAAAPAPQQSSQVRYSAPAPDLGGGFIEFLFGGGHARAPRYQDNPGQLPLLRQPEPAPQMYVHGGDPSSMAPARPAVDPRYHKQVVNYEGREKPGTIIIDTPSRHLYLGAGRRQGAPLRHRRRSPRLHLGRREVGFAEARMAGLACRRRRC